MEEKKIIRYRVFKSSSHFEEFQRKNNVGIMSVTPYIEGFETKERSSMTTTTVDPAAFVTYIDLSPVPIQK